jgi:hypothetical protein
MSHPVVLALFDKVAAAGLAIGELLDAGVAREEVSIVARSHEEEGALAREMGGSPGVDIEDSRVAARLGELSGQLLAAIAIVLPGLGPIVAAGPLAADFGEAAGHAVGGVARLLTQAGVKEPEAQALQRAVENGAILVGVHVRRVPAGTVGDTLARHGGREIVLASWPD